MSESKSTVSTAREDQLADELSLLDLITFVRRNLRSLLGGTLLGGVLGLVIAFAIPAQWEASALIRVGQLGGTTIEPSLLVIDRIKNKSFQNDVLKGLGLSIDESNEIAKDFRDSLKAKLEKSDLISLTIRSADNEEAKRYMSAVISEVKNIHSKISAPTINRWQEELAAIEQELKLALAESERLVKSLDGREASNEKSFSQAALLSSILLASEAELRDTRHRKRVVKELLSPERTYAAQGLGRVEVSEKPVFPKKSLFAVAGLFLGLLLAVLSSILKPICARRSA